MSKIRWETKYNNVPLQGSKRLVQPYRLEDYYKFKEVNDPDYFKRKNIRSILFVSDEEYNQILDKVNKTILPYEIVDAAVLITEEEEIRKERIEAQAERDERLMREQEIERSKKTYKEK